MHRSLPTLALLAALTLPAGAFAQSAETTQNAPGPVAMPGFNPSTHVALDVKMEGGASQLFTNGPFKTGTTAEIGTTVPTSGYEWSEVAHDTGNTTEANTNAGAGCLGPVRLADDFTVPSGQTWTIEQIAGYAYQTSYAGASSPINTAVLQIWDGPPGVTGSNVIFGDATTNRLASSVEAQAYRIFNSAVPNTANPPGTTRRVWTTTMNVSPALPLSAGTYWIDYSFGVSTGTSLFCPLVTTPGARTQPGQNGRQFLTGAWAPFIDAGTPATAPDVAQDFPFIVYGTTGTPSSPILTVNPTTVNFGNVASGAGAGPTNVTLQNSGSGTIAISSITASGTGYSVNLTGTDLSLAAGESTTFAVSFAGSTTPGAANGSVSIVSDAPGSPASVTLTANVQPAGGPTVYPSTAAVPITDNSPTGITSTIVVPAGAANVLDLDVDLRITHSWVGDIIVALDKNGGTPVTLVDRPGLPATGTLGCEENNIRAFADDEGTLGSFEAGCPGTTTANEAFTLDGHYTPEQPLSAFDNASASGTWTLRVSDNAQIDTGTLNSWALLVTGTIVANEGGAAAASRLVVAPNPVSASGQVTLSVATSQSVRVAIYDMLGREVRVIFERPIAASQEAYIAFRTDDLPAGQYIVRATGDTVNLTQRVTVAH